jgi:hypothetical protein
MYTFTFHSEKRQPPRFPVGLNEMTPGHPGRLQVFFFFPVTGQPPSASELEVKVPFGI